MILQPRAKRRGLLAALVAVVLAPLPMSRGIVNGAAGNFAFHTRSPPPPVPSAPEASGLVHGQRPHRQSQACCP